MTTAEQFNSPIKKPQPGTISEAILTLAALTPATPGEIAETVKTSRQMVHQVFERYGIKPNHAKSYKEHRADILAGLQEKILATIDEEEIKKATVLQKVTSAGILYDKEQIERGHGGDARPMIVIQIKGDATINAVEISPTLPK